MQKAMAILKIITFCLYFVVVAKAAGPRVVGGKEAANAKYPYQVSLRIADTHFCGGSIIDNRWILTAAHCLVGIPSSRIHVVAGTNSLRSGKCDQVYQAEYTVYHEKFQFSGNTNDIGLIRLTRNIDFNRRVKPIKLPTDNSLQANAPVTLTGWGRLQTNGRVPDRLQEIELRTIAEEACNSLMSGEIDASHICTLTKADEGACNGDSGGPLVANDIQVGIVSYGHACARGYPDVFTRVFSFLNWIRAEIEKF